MTKYTDQTDRNLKRLEISFIGMEWKDDKRTNPNVSDVTVRLLNCKNLNNQFIPIGEIWKATFKQKMVPYGIWNGFKLGELTETNVFLALGASIHELDIKTGDIKWTFTRGNTPIHYINLTPDDSELNILYSPEGFDTVKERSNFLRLIIRSGCSLKWSSQLIWENDLIANFDQSAKGLFAWTMKGVCLKIDEKRGTILESEFVK